MESIYQIRALINNHGQAFIKDFDIYIFVDEIK